MTSERAEIEKKREGGIERGKERIECCMYVCVCERTNNQYLKMNKTNG